MAKAIKLKKKEKKIPAAYVKGSQKHTITENIKKNGKSEYKSDWTSTEMTRDKDSPKGAYRQRHEAKTISTGKRGKVKVKYKWRDMFTKTYKGTPLLEEVRVSADPKRNKELTKIAKERLKRKKKFDRQDKRDLKKSDRAEGRVLTKAERKRRREEKKK